MSEHDQKTHPVPAVIMAVVIAVLTYLGIGLMNAGQVIGCAIAAVLLGAIGVYASLVMGRP